VLSLNRSYLSQGFIENLMNLSQHPRAFHRAENKSFCQQGQCVGNKPCDDEFVLVLQCFRVFVQDFEEELSYADEVADRRAQCEDYSELLHYR